MTVTKHEIGRRLLAGVARLAAVIPLNALAEGDSKGFLNNLGAETVVVALLLANSLLLLGFLIRLQRMRRSLTRQTAALERTVENTRLMGDKLPNITLFQLECSGRTEFSFRYISEGYEEVMRIDRNRVLQQAKLAFDHVYEADIPYLREAYEQARETLEPTDLNIRVLDISGNLKWLHISAVPRREGDLLVWDGIMQDISDGKNIEAALMEEKRNFQNLFETIDDFMLVCDMNGNLLSTNPSVELRLGYATEKLGEMSLYELYPESLRTEVYQIVALMHSEDSATCSLPLQTRDGDTIPVEMNLFQGFWKNRKAIFAIARDTTHRRQTETALRESQEMLLLIMDTIPMSVFWKNKDSVYLGCNSAFIRECGLSDTREVVGKTPYDLFDAQTAAALIAYDRQVMATNQPILNALLPYSRPDGTTGQRESSKIPLHNEEGQAVGVLGIWRDVTEQNQAGERLKRTLEDMERFNQLMRGRERRTLELKTEINRLLEELGREVKYQTTSDTLK